MMLGTATVIVLHVSSQSTVNCVNHVQFSRNGGYDMVQCDAIQRDMTCPDAEANTLEMPGADCSYCCKDSGRDECVTCLLHTCVCRGGWTKV